MENEHGQEKETPLLDSMRLAEAAIYIGQYQHPTYKMGEQRKADVRRLLANTAKGSYLDVSTGRGEALDIAENLGFDPVMATETVPDLLNYRTIHAYSIALPFSEDSFDVVTCFDVLEHLIEEDLIPSIQEFCRVAAREVIVSCSEIPSSMWGGGRDLHISKRPAAEWLKLVQEAAPGWAIEQDGTAGGSPVFRITK